MPLWLEYDRRTKIKKKNQYSKTDLQITVEKSREVTSITKRKKDNIRMLKKLRVAQMISSFENCTTCSSVSEPSEEYK